MTEHTCWESIRVEGNELIEQVKKIIHEGNVRRIRIKQNQQVVAEFPLAVGVVGTVISPILAAVGTLAALLTDCSIDIERVVPTPADSSETDENETPRT